MVSRGTVISLRILTVVVDEITRQLTLSRASALGSVA
jgi:hypothetical protein